MAEVLNYIVSILQYVKHESTAGYINAIISR